ncbi:hypothetical protein BJ970_006929 [Saccharopolyspora phatthalungensis]|uniref:Uncharacterized protein n=1 Tax=Saccharopolyspora phatthalungensis TaxID=664693 RepID=A0A840QH76_9PSEU|nr:hypothetical protein [Saccharopolyspora phatthalungensis]
MATTYLQLARGSGRAADVIWAEDGGVFFNQAIRHPLWHNIFVPHAGYLQVIARVAVQPAAHLPLSWVAWWLAGIAALTVAFVSLVVWFASVRVVRSWWARALLTALVPLLPQAGFEVNATVCNLHWYLAYAAFWVLLAASNSWRGQLGALFVVALAALSDPLTALVLPAAVVGVLRSPRRRLALIAPVGMIVALASQAWVHLTRTVPYRASPTDFAELPRIYAARVALPSATGDRLLGPIHERLGMPVVVLAGALVCAALIALVLNADRKTRLVAFLSLAVSVAFLFVPVGLRGTAGFFDGNELGLAGSRYTIVPILMLWTAMVMVLDRLADRALPTGAPGLIGTTTVAVLAVQLITDWGGPTVRANGPSWQAEVRAAQVNCQGPPGSHGFQETAVVAEAHGKTSAPIVPAPDDITISLSPLPPAGASPLFAVVVPCAKLRDIR